MHTLRYVYSSSTFSSLGLLSFFTFKIKICAIHIFISGPRCCGSRLDVKQMVASPEFRRFGSGGSFFVNYTISTDIDVIPPSRIIDFRRNSKSSFDSNRFISFDWTAPGNDFVFGKATEYNIECFGSMEEIVFDKTELPQPDVYGTRQSASLQITIINKVLLCTIFAFDEVSVSITLLRYWLSSFRGRDTELLKLDKF